jgi:1,4-alpha-glucan branching enzyme
LESLIRQLACDGRLELLTPGEYLERHGTTQQAEPAASSWGENGYNEFWLNGTNSWIYPHLHQAVRDMRGLVSTYPQSPEDGLVKRGLRQAARSLLLVEASDWAFLLRTGAAQGYARGRIRDQLARFRYLRDGLRASRLDERCLSALEQMDNLFPSLDLRLFA